MIASLTASGLVRGLRAGLVIALLELSIWLWIVYPPLIAACLLAVPGFLLLPLWWKLPKFPVFLARLSILWIAILMGYAIMEIIAHPLVRALAVGQGVIEVLVYFLCIGVIRAHTPHG